jgi:hypothetical protein
VTLIKIKWKKDSKNIKAVYIERYLLNPFKAKSTIRAASGWDVAQW